MLKRVEFNFSRFNEQLMEEVHTEEEFEENLISSTQLAETHDQLESLYSSADKLKDDLKVILDQSRVTLDNIMAPENLKKRSESGKNFDPNQV